MSLSRFPPWAFLIIGIAPITLLLVFGDGLPKAAVSVAATIAVVWAAVMVTLHWKRLDEAARAAHRWAWYWGGSLGLAAAMITGALALTTPGVASAIAATTSPLVNPNLPVEQSYLFLGVLLAGLAQGAGFIGAWIYWWVAKR